MKIDTLSVQEFLKQEDDIVLQKRCITGLCAMHEHEFIEIAYIADGTGTHTICGDVVKISAGDLFLLNDHVPHEFLADSREPLIIYNCIFLPLSVDDSLQTDGNFVELAYEYLLHALHDREGAPQYLRLSDTERSNFRALLEEMYTEYQNQAAGYRQILRADLIRLLILCFRLYHENPGHDSVFENLVARQVQNYLNIHYAEPIRCDELAARSYLSVSYFNKLFKKSTGMTPIQLLQNIRIENACRLLTSTNLSVTQVAEQVGYSDVKYFYQLFERCQGMSPGRYRAEHGGIR